jgi:hypothetical protein
MNDVLLAIGRIALAEQRQNGSGLRPDPSSDRALTYPATRVTALGSSHPHSENPHT